MTSSGTEGILNGRSKERWEPGASGWHDAAVAVKEERREPRVLVSVAQGSRGD